jgi:hypothetical protein
MSLPAPSQPPTELDESSIDIRFDDIRTEFHPASGKEPVIAHFEDYGRAEEFAYNDPPSQQPWAPFESRLDFEIAELILLAALNKEQTTTLISLLKHVANGAEEFTLRSHDDIKKKWEKASDICTKVSHNMRISMFVCIESMCLPVPKGDCDRSLQEC